ncbi:hypothetical protein Vafri_7159 [Volvox africanus]|uniref:tRNA(adenine(34)) deaminase n=1 Tax=Volvox africanus TaxID=51714 RepID=A0A8J4B0C4_9CHLO|nr:hypothetical protein Vafri_7159 [Volvox africanus]
MSLMACILALPTRGHCDATLKQGIRRLDPYQMRAAARSCNFSPRLGTPAATPLLYSTWHILPFHATSSSIDGYRTVLSAASNISAPTRQEFSVADLQFMDEALDEARTAAAEGEIPVGAVLVHDGRIVARGHNRVETLRSPLAHAEMLCLAAGASKLRAWRLLGATMYVTLEPCPMCAGAILQARLARVVYGARQPRLGADGSWLQLFPRSSGSSADLQPRSAFGGAWKRGDCKCGRLDYSSDWESDAECERMWSSRGDGDHVDSDSDRGCTRYNGHLRGNVDPDQCQDAEPCAAPSLGRDAEGPGQKLRTCSTGGAGRYWAAEVAARNPVWDKDSDEGAVNGSGRFHQSDNGCSHAGDDSAYGCISVSRSIGRTLHNTGRHSVSSCGNGGPRYNTLDDGDGGVGDCNCSIGGSGHIRNASGVGDDRIVGCCKECDESRSNFGGEIHGSDCGNGRTRGASCDGSDWVNPDLLHSPRHESMVEADSTARKGRRGKDKASQGRRPRLRGGCAAEEPLPLQPHPFHTSFEVQGGCLADESAELMRSFFRRRRRECRRDRSDVFREVATV